MELARFNLGWEVSGGFKRLSPHPHILYVGVTYELRLPRIQLDYVSIIVYKNPYNLSIAPPF
jgi:hypothetical protein